MSVDHSGFSTQAIHVGNEPDRITGDIIPPVHIASTFVMDGVGILRAGYDYGRGTNPTRDAYQVTLGALEGGEAVAFPAGLSAEDTLLRVLSRPGDHLTFSSDVYGGTYRLFTRIHAAEGRKWSEVDAGDLDAVEQDLAANRPRVLWVETPSNPLLDVYDIAALAQLAHAYGALLVVDNTFASPYLQRPLALGADAVIHSTTKYIGGHSDLVGGAAIVASNLVVPEGIEPWTDNGLVSEELVLLQTATGAIPSPEDSYKATRGLKTLAVRVDRQSRSALEIADFLEVDPRVKTVNYPGLPSHRGHQLALSQMSGGFGGVLSFTVATPEDAIRVCESTQTFSLAVSLGAVESLIEYPATMTHGTKEGSATAVDPSLVRLSVGLEDVEDLIADLDRALG